jgi:ATP-binding cassette subfamily A (ABC1) protein 3
MARITAGFSPSQLHAVQKVDSENDIAMICRQNFNGLSDCYAAIIFEQLPGNNSNSNVQYTIQVDVGLFYINVATHASDFERRVLPVQWAIDQVSILHRLI